MICNDYASPSISVFVRDNVTGAYIASGATLVVRDGDFVDSASYPAGEPAYNSVLLATDDSYERDGFYDVTVRRTGYADWVRQGVAVTKGRCHVRSVVLTARLSPSP